MLGFGLDHGSGIGSYDGMYVGRLDPFLKRFALAEHLRHRARAAARR